MMKLDFSNPQLKAELAAIGINNFPSFLDESESATLHSIAQVALVPEGDIVHSGGRQDHLNELSNELRFLKFLKTKLYHAQSGNEYRIKEQDELAS